MSSDQDAETLVQDWSAEIEKFESELDCMLRDRATIWHIYDWIGALCLRDRVERRLAHDEMPVALAAVDARFRTMTADVGRDWIITGVAAEPSNGWWWERLPIRLEGRSRRTGERTGS